VHEEEPEEVEPYLPFSQMVHEGVAMSFVEKALTFVMFA